MLPNTMVQQKLLKNFTSCVKLWKKKGDVMEVGEEQDMLMEKLKKPQQSFKEEREKSEKGSETFQVLQKDLKFAKSARKLADNSTCLYSYSFKINTREL